MKLIFFISKQEIKLNDAERINLFQRHKRKTPFSYKQKGIYMKSQEWKSMQKVWLHEKGYRCQMFPFLVLGQHKTKEGWWNNAIYGKYAIHHINRKAYENLGMEKLDKDVIVLSKFAHEWVYHFLLSFGKKRVRDQKFIKFANPFQSLMNYWCFLNKWMKLIVTIFFLISFSILSYSQEVVPDKGTYGNPETLPKEIRLRVECFLGVKIIISYDQSEGSHNCNAAEFNLFANDEKLLNINDSYTANLNNGDNDEVLLNGNTGLVKELLNLEYPNIGGSRGESFVISTDNAINIFKNGVEEVTLFLECATREDGDRGHGYGKCHSNVPDVKIIKTSQGNGETVLYHNKPNVVNVSFNIGKDRVALITINPCGELINEGN